MQTLACPRSRCSCVKGRLPTSGFLASLCSSIRSAEFSALLRSGDGAFSSSRLVDGLRYMWHVPVFMSEVIRLVVSPLWCESQPCPSPGVHFLYGWKHLTAQVGSIVAQVLCACCGLCIIDTRDCPQSTRHIALMHAHTPCDTATAA